VTNHDNQDLLGPKSPEMAVEPPPSPPGDLIPGNVQDSTPIVTRDASGRWLKGVSGCPAGRPVGRYSIVQRMDRGMKGPISEAHRTAAAIGCACRTSDVPEFEVLGELVVWVKEMRALMGHDADFKEIGDRLDPKPNKVDMTIGPPKRAAVPDGAPGDAEREAAESFYDSLASDG